MYILDTCVLIWLEESPKKIPIKVMDILVAPENQIYVSVVSFWELGLKEVLNFEQSMTLVEYADGIKENYNFELLPIAIEACSQLKKLPPIHKDPFDRMLIAQAIVTGAKLVTSDKDIQKYPVQVFW